MRAAAPGRIQGLAACAVLIALVVLSLACQQGEPPQPEESVVERGKYLATIGVCEACHTPPAVPVVAPAADDSLGLFRDRVFRTDPDWVKYLDSTRTMAGGVPFLLRFGPDLNGVVYTRNITPDSATGLGTWTEDEIIEVIRSGKRKDGSTLFLFPPHSFFAGLAREDARALAVYLRSLAPVTHSVPERSLPFPVQPATNLSSLEVAPQGRTPTRAAYLMNGLVGCRECHSYNREGALQAFVGGDRSDPFLGVFRAGPDLPLRTLEHGFAAFPYPGYALIYAPNLTRFGAGGDLAQTTPEAIVRAIRQGIAPEPDTYGALPVLVWVKVARLAA